MSSAIHICLLHCTELHAIPFQNMNQSCFQNQALFYLCKTWIPSKKRNTRLTWNIFKQPVMKLEIAEIFWIFWTCKTTNLKIKFICNPVFVSKFYYFTKSANIDNIVLLIIKVHCFEIAENMIDISIKQNCNIPGYRSILIIGGRWTFPIVVGSRLWSTGKYHLSIIWTYQPWRVVRRLSLSCFY